ncbi:MAG: hypothetical protein LBM27_00620, partial [Lactobacillaceae bacterium]|nr:hypothetical protein [Lactobacillaceae bacterium]
MVPDKIIEAIHKDYKFVLWDEQRENIVQDPIDIELQGIGFELVPFQDGVVIFDVVSGYELTNPEAWYDEQIFYRVEEVVSAINDIYSSDHNPYDDGYEITGY